MKTQNQLSKKELATRWGVTVRSVERIRARYGLVPVFYFGKQPAFDVADIERLEKRRTADLNAQAGRLRSRILTVREAKAQAGRKGGAR